MKKIILSLIVLMISIFQILPTFGQAIPEAPALPFTILTIPQATGVPSGSVMPNLGLNKLIETIEKQNEVIKNQTQAILELSNQVKNLEARVAELEDIEVQ